MFTQLHASVQSFKSQSQVSFESAFKPKCKEFKIFGWFVPVAAEFQTLLKVKVKVNQSI